MPTYNLMALYWLQNGVKGNTPWTAPPNIEENKPQLNPYVKSIQQSKQTEQKITLVKQLMKKNVKSLTPETPLNEALAMMRTNGIRHAPIIESETQIFLGIISDRDILKKWAGVEESFLEWVNKTDHSSDYVSYCMTKKVLVASPDDRIVDVAQAMTSEKIGCMPVLDKENKLLGLITRSDILKLIVKTAPLNFWL